MADARRSHARPARTVRPDRRTHDGAAGTALLLVAHGSRDPRHAATLRTLADGVRSLAGLRTGIAFLEFDRPGVADAVGAAVSAGADRVVVVPLLLSRAYHATTDLPAALAEGWGVPVHTTDVLGGSPLLVAALERRLSEAGAGSSGRDSTGVVVAATGSRDAGARASVAAVARALRRAGRPTSFPRTSPVPAVAPATRYGNCAREGRGGWPSPRTSWPPACFPSGSPPRPPRPARTSWPRRWAPPRNSYGSWSSGGGGGRRVKHPPGPCARPSPAPVAARLLGRKNAGVHGPGARDSVRLLRVRRAHPMTSGVGWNSFGSIPLHGESSGRDCPRAGPSAVTGVPLAGGMARRNGRDTVVPRYRDGVASPVPGLLGQ